MSSAISDKTLLILTGPTAVGKTETTIELAQSLHTPILSADSRQFFREMRIGTAFPTDEERAAAEHHFLGMLSIHDYYNVYMFEQDVLKLLDRLFVEHPVVIMTGGSPQYLSAVCNGIDEIPDVDFNTRQYVNNLFKNNGLDAITAQLDLLDPDYFNTNDRFNHKRMIRALEVCLYTKKPYTSFLKKRETKRDFRILKYYLNRPRETLFGRINRRVDKMMSDGLLEEVRSLLPYRHLNALNTVGYKELFDYIDGKTSLERAVDDIKTHTRRYAKKQLTWFKKDYTEILIPDGSENKLDTESLLNNNNKSTDVYKQTD